MGWLKRLTTTRKPEIENKMLDTSGLASNTSFYSKVTEIENKISNITNLVTTTAQYTKATDINYKIPNITLVTKATLQTKVTEIENIWY